ncbi:MAG: hypothetical protein J3Q66DRAFT_332346 [Benniella sp.]|nr:MAG: hypothetical protein J3Q66DRAFT_332346 [Benniella sp.]
MRALLLLLLLLLLSYHHRHGLLLLLLLLLLQLLWPLLLQSIDQLGLVRGEGVQGIGIPARHYWDKAIVVRNDREKQGILRAGLRGQKSGVPALCIGNGIMGG